MRRREYFLADANLESLRQGLFAESSPLRPEVKNMERALGNRGVSLGEALSSLTMAQGTSAFLFRHGTWYSTSVSVGPSGTSRPAALPSSLVGAVDEGSPARQREIIGGQPAVAVGVPLRSVQTDYFEVHSLSELSATLEVLASVVFGCAAATTVAPGFWSAGGRAGGWCGPSVPSPRSHLPSLGGARQAPPGGG